MPAPSLPATDLPAGLDLLHPPPRIPPPTTVRPVPIDPNGRSGPTPGRARGPYWRRTSPGLFVPTNAIFDQPAQRIIEAADWLPPGGAVTGWAALHLAGAAYFEGVDARGNEQPVPLAMGTGHRLRVPGAVQTRASFRPDEVVVHRGVRCLVPARAAFDEMRRLRDLRLAVAALEMTFYAELTSLRRFTTYVARLGRRPGIVLVRQALELAREGAESPPEVATRLVWELDAGLPPLLCNRDLLDLDGRFLGRPDLLDVAAGVVGEYDGAHHRETRARSNDIGREVRLRDHGLEFFSVVGGELKHPARVVARMRSTRARALASTLPLRWTLEHPRRSVPPSLDERIDLRGNWIRVQ